MNNNHTALRIDGPHDHARLHVAGELLSTAKAAMLMIHGRGATAVDILSLASELDVDGFSYVAPQAVGNTWYPYPFMTPMHQNEPWLTSALAVVGASIEWIEQQGIKADKLILLGFSQGACLTTEYCARNARRYGGIIGLSGGLIGPDGTPREYSGSLDETPVFLGCSDVDFHIPKERVIETEAVLRRMGGQVTARLYAGMGHTVNEDELAFVREVMRSII